MAVFHLSDSWQSRQRFRRIVIAIGILGAVVLLIAWVGGCLRRARESPLRFWAVSFSPDARSLVTGGGEIESSAPGELLFWDIDHGGEHVVRQRGSIRSVAWSPDGKFIVSGDFAGATKMVNPETGQFLMMFPPPARQVNAVAISRDSKLVASATFDGTIEVWDVAGTEKHLFMAPSERFLDVAIAPDCGSLVATTQSGKAFLYTLTENLDPLVLWACPEPPDTDRKAECAAFSPDSMTFATGAGDRLRIWETGTGEMKRDIIAGTEVDNVAYSPDGASVATVHSDGSLMLWNPRTGAMLNWTQAHPGDAFGLAFASDGRRIATVARDDFTVKIWNATNLQLEACLRWPKRK